MRPVPETKIEKYLVDQIEKLGGMCVKGIPVNNRGMPDRVCILPQGLVVFVECKRPGLKPRPNQRYYLKKLQARGHHAIYVSNHSMIDNLVEWILDYQKNRKVTKRINECRQPYCEQRWV